ncbi:MAG: tRNA (adenosine(37)-N6)-threonylcarbamoyltransferase complex dimerization subunit type 1 TsaB [Dehalococcoidales bacterium]|nr:tRNA (adenosine(37)-N6)-threonylcarbamoyltransferase complex dimerization subunit type 1 TsaB [Dehalococcoidales bacterium]
MQLAIDTSTDTASLALAQDGEILAELSWRCGQNHTITLLPYLTSLLSQAGLELGAVTGITVARGPGSYNGLRVGISTAKGLALSLGVPIVGISTLAAAAYQHAGAGLPVGALFNAGRGEIAAAVYDMRGDSWQPVIAEHITTVEALCAWIDKKTVFCGELSEALGDQLRERLGEKALIVSAAARLRRAGFLAELGEKRLAAGDFDSPASLSPMYLRRPHITKPRSDKK